MHHAGVVMVRCPTTGRELSTGIEMDAATFEQLPEYSLANNVSRLQARPYLVNARGMAR